MFGADSLKKSENVYKILKKPLKVSSPGEAPLLPYLPAGMGGLKCLASLATNICDANPVEKKLLL